MIIHIDNTRPEIQTDDAFIAAANQKYGSRGRRQAEEFAASFPAMMDEPEMTEQEYISVCKALRTIFFETKEINKKYTPKKYRQ